MNEIQTALIAAKTLISYPSEWTTFFLARSREGDDCAPNSPQAVRWCALGAVDAVARANIIKIWDLLAEAAIDMGADEENFKHPAAQINDNHGHAAVMRMYDRAIQLAE